jgi:small subunit ribosomal protein S14
MARLSVVVRNKKRQEMVEKYAALREQLKKEGNMKALRELPRNSSPIRVKSRCSITGRGRAVYKKFGFTRHIFRQFALEGKIPGVKKASW